jgi:hypothetical protein
VFGLGVDFGTEGGSIIRTQGVTENLTKKMGIKNNNFFITELLWPQYQMTTHLLSHSDTS